MSEILKFHQWKYEQQNKPQFKLKDPSFEHVIRIKDEVSFSLWEPVKVKDLFWVITYFYRDLIKVELSYRFTSEELLTRTVEINELTYLG